MLDDRAGDADRDAPGSVAFDTLVETQASVDGRGPADQVAYYAGAVAALFVLLSAVHAAASIHEDVDAGIVERVLAGRAGIAALVLLTVLHASIYLIHLVGAILLIGRLFHAVSLSTRKLTVTRMIGMVLTFTAYVIAAVRLLLYAFA